MTSLQLATIEHLVMRCDRRSQQAEREKKEEAHTLGMYLQSLARKVGGPSAYLRFWRAFPASNEEARNVGCRSSIELPL
jgi:hypothetical protein